MATRAVLAPAMLAVRNVVQLETQWTGHIHSSAHTPVWHASVQTLQPHSATPQTDRADRQRQRQTGWIAGWKTRRQAGRPGSG
eukprot:3502916-Rhodomonas_salina.1